MGENLEKNKLTSTPIQSSPHPLMGSVDRVELTGMENMSTVSSTELKKRFEAIDLQVKQLEEEIRRLKHEKNKLSLKWTEDNPI